MSKKLMKALMNAVEKGDEAKDEVDGLIESDRKYLGSKYLNSAIVKAVENGYLEIVKILLEKGANVNLLTNDDVDATLLYIAMDQGTSEMVELLLENGAVVDELSFEYIMGNRVSITPLLRAVTKLIHGWVPAQTLFHYHDIIKILLEKGANVNFQRYDGATPLYIAVIGGYFETVKLLLENGADVDLPAVERIDYKPISITPLFKAVSKLQLEPVPRERSLRYSDIIKILLQYGADMHKKNENNLSPLDIAENNPEIKALLIEGDKQNKIVLMHEIYGEQGLVLGDNGMDVGSRKLLYSFLGGKKQKSTRKYKNIKKRKSTRNRPKTKK